MNKELIKKYKKEFEYWLDGGKLLAWYPDASLGWINPDKSINIKLWNQEKALIIINDKYVEFRKALAEGKTIQYLNVNGIWKDTEHTNFSLILKHYRIKPNKIKLWYWEYEDDSGDWGITHIRFSEEQVKDFKYATFEKVEVLGFKYKNN